jgi:hypothetical protein
LAHYARHVCVGLDVRNSSGNFATLAAIRRASSFVSNLAAERRPAIRHLQVVERA